MRSSNYMKKYSYIFKAVCFCAVLSLVLVCISSLSQKLSINKKPEKNYSTQSIFDEPKNSIDVLTIGASCVYSGVSPMEWWNNYGYTGFSWGEARQSIFDTKQYLKKIYKCQSPKVVFLDVVPVFQENNDTDNLDSIAKTKISNLFPIFNYHRFISLKCSENINADNHSVFKGYRASKKIVESDSICDYMDKKPKFKKHKDKFNISSLCENALTDCIEICKKNNSEVVLLSIPDRKEWNYKMSKYISDYAMENDIKYLDLNLLMNSDIDWKKDSCDGGMHMNNIGMKKVTNYIGNYLLNEFSLPDHRNHKMYSQWEEDFKVYNKYMCK